MKTHRRVSTRQWATPHRTVRYLAGRPASTLPRHPVPPGHRPAQAHQPQAGQWPPAGQCQPAGQWPQARRAPLAYRSPLMAERIAVICVAVGGAGLPVTIWLAFAGAPSSALTSVGVIAATAMSTAGIHLRRRW